MKKFSIGSPCLCTVLCRVGSGRVRVDHVFGVGRVVGHALTTGTGRYIEVCQENGVVGHQFGVGRVNMSDESRSSDHSQPYSVSTHVLQCIPIFAIFQDGHQFMSREVNIDPETRADIQTIKRSLRYYMRRRALKEQHARICREWRLLALVVDRIFFIIYLGAIILSLCVMLPTSSYGGETLESEMVFENTA